MAKEKKQGLAMEMDAAPGGKQTQIPIIQGITRVYVYMYREI